MQGTSSGSGEKEAEAVGVARSAGGRPDFVSNLGRRLSELTSFLKGLEQEPGSPRLRDDLRRRVHALSTGARHLRFTAMATALAETERLLERAAAVGGLEAADLAALAAIFEGLPSLAHDSQQTIPPATSAPIGKKGGVPPSVMVVGPTGLADAIANPLEHGGDAEMECERIDSTAAALELARTLAPDLAVVDADLPGAKDLVGKLTHDFLAVPMPIIVVGTWS